MKRRISVFLMTIFVVALLPGCRKSEPSEPVASKEYVSYVTNFTTDGIIWKWDKEWWTGLNLTDPAADQSLTLVYEGKEYQLQYDWTDRDYGNHYITRQYSTRGENPRKYFFLDGRNGEILGVQDLGALEDFSAKDVVKNLSQARKTAKQYMKKRFGIDLSQYELEGEGENPGVQQEIEGKLYEIKKYYFRYRKRCGDYLTSDCVALTVTSKGAVYSYWILNQGLFDDVSVDKIDREGLQRSIDLKLQEVYSGKVVSFDPEIIMQILCYSPDGQLVVESRIESQIETLSGEKRKTGIGLSTVVEESTEEFWEKERLKY